MKLSSPRAARRCVSLFLGLIGLGMVPGLKAGPLGLVLPTENDAIFSEDPSKFYMYTDRNFEGVRSQPWTAGRYGLVRDQKRTDQGIVFTKFHEGVDIRPVKRDAAGEPLDDVFAIADGKVAYVSTTPSRSNYGNYVVIEHDCGEGGFYSLYAHLKSSMVAAGQPVKARQRIGRLGYTGEGINRERAHVHLEVTLMLSSRFQNWYNRHFTTTNWHGNFNGFNLCGVDVSGLYHSHRDDPNIKLSDFVTRDAPYFRVVVANRGTPDLLKRYPWLGKDMEKAAGNSSWEFTFNNVGVPLSIAPDTRSVTYPAVSWVRDSKVNHAFNTLARLSGTGSKAALTASGSRYIQLVSGAF
ncbi:MAG: M23 family metallopeptidase [Verrucomicrobiae bacterium]|nr:M23 family metallopeptidase [Verrucomicrobiae bacterium]